ncbi:MAG: tRNA pseudouridine(55) synthase TruB [Gemmatimonadota bacterium]
MGLLPVDKPVGPTSHDIVNRARRALGIRRIGHTGTLDPFASGLLLLCVGAATRLAEYLDILDKEYEATAVLGRGTTTDDRLGETVFASEAWKALDPEAIATALGDFRGTTLQVPPAYSAKKVGGEAMYHKARRGEVVELPPVEVRVASVELLEVTLPEVRFRLRCSTGTYVRAIARDLGTALGVGAHLSELRRTGIGRFRVSDAVPAEALADPARVAAGWIPPLDALAHLPFVEVDEAGVLALVQGRALPHPDAGAAGPVAVVHDGALVAIGSIRDDRLKPRKVFARA